jgi:hypothetical protein
VEIPKPLPLQLRLGRRTKTLTTPHPQDCQNGAIENGPHDAEEGFGLKVPAFVDGLPALLLRLISPLSS